MNPFPNETPEYRAAREELLAAEVELRRQTERVAAQSRELPLGGRGAISHWWSSELLTALGDPGEHPRHVDYVWPIWAVFDVTPDGRGTDWHPALEYD